MSNKMSINNIAIKLNNVNKRYTIHHEKPTLVEHLIKGRNEEFWALKDINLEIKKGEKVGIIGPNGSGKTTLLKIIAGITTPTSGSVKTNGKIVSLIDLEAGFHPELTGIDNIYLNGMLLGMGKQKISDKLSAIISFADVGQFIDVPFYTYSSGMALRLGFAIAVYAEPDVLILDENLSVGDKEFSTRAEKKVNQFFRENRTIILASHRLDVIKKNCNTTILFKNGEIVRKGKFSFVEKFYQHSNCLYQHE